MKRRDCLKKFGALSSGIAISGATASKLPQVRADDKNEGSTFDRIYKQAWRKKRTEGYDSFLKHLRRHGIRGSVREKTINVERPSSDDISTERYFDDQLTLNSRYLMIVRSRITSELTLIGVGTTSVR